ncbi:MAG: PKD domain-containing protein [Chitinophagaceae bacterium]|nr:PKD domain-containing protein [Chitinophagaceae bacterium]
MATLKSSIFFVVLLAFAFAAGAQDYSNIEFIENKGQWDSRVRYKGEINSGAIFIRNTGFTVLQHQPDEYALIQNMIQHHDQKGLDAMRRADGKLAVNSHAWNVDFVGASPRMRVVPDKALPSHNNYFLGNDPSKWAAECKIYQAMTLEDVYPNVDVRYYTYNGMLKYDIVAKPGSDISKIALRYEGIDKMEVRSKELVLKTSLGERKESSPYTYQADGKERKEVSCKYVIKGDLVTFDIKGYDRNSTLVIDPTLIFCSLSNSTASNWGFTATYGPDGSFYGGGIVFEGNSFPVSPGAFQTVFQGGVGEQGTDMGIIRLSANGSTRLFATYLGGSRDEQPHSLIVDAAGNVIIAGRTNSTTGGPGGLFPTTGPTIGTGGDYDIAIVKLSANGGTLLGSRLIGGSNVDGVNIREGRNGTISLQQNYGDDGRSEVILDAANNIYVASCTQSTNFPVFNGFQAASGGNQDAVVIKMNASLTGDPLFSSYLGGDRADAAYVLSLAPNGDIFVAGGTESGNFPGNHAGTIGTSNNGGIDGFVAQISNDGSSLIRSTYIGTANDDQIFGVQFDRNGFPYIMGQTTGDMPAINSTYNPAGGKQFIAKLQPDLSAYVYRTRFGTGASRPNISPTAFLVDRCENVYVSGWGGAISTQSNPYLSAGTQGLPVTPDALQPNTDGRDFYFFVLKKDASGPLYASFFGQAGGFTDHVDGGTSRFDRNGVIYQGVCANCGGNAIFPTTPGVWGPVKPASAVCNLGMIKIAFNLAGVGATLRSEIGGVVNDTAGCVPLDVTFTDLVRNAKEYIWNFGDGSPEVGPIAATAGGYQQSHTYTSTGTFRVMLIAIDPASCNERDTVYMNIRVGDLEANLRANVVKLDPCDAFNYRFDNLSTTLPSHPFTDTSFTWNFGDGSPRVRAGLAPVTHAYAAPGTYNAWLILNDTTYCNNPDSIQVVVRVSANVDASFDAPPVGCAPDNVAFTYTGTGGQTFEWDFGDPASGSSNTSALANPTHLYATPGTYTVRLIVIDPNTCNVRDTVFGTINVFQKPTANFVYSPVTPVVNTPHIFTNTSSLNATRFKWDFGDGTILETTTRDNITHQFNATGKFNVCLIAFNESGCSDTLCEPVSAIVVPALDVPNAFTPNSGDINSRIMVKGFGIAKMRFIIWNRWGQKVFETNNQLQGWDGRVKGVVQPMDVYAYTLDVEFFDGTKATKKGDITLIR